MVYYILLLIMLQVTYLRQLNRNHLLLCWWKPVLCLHTNNGRRSAVRCTLRAGDRLLVARSAGSRRPSVWLTLEAGDHLRCLVEHRSRRPAVWLHTGDRRSAIWLHTEGRRPAFWLHTGGSRPIVWLHTGGTKADKRLIIKNVQCTTKMTTECWRNAVLTLHGPSVSTRVNQEGCALRRVCRAQCCVWSVRQRAAVFRAKAVVERASIAVGRASEYSCW